MAMRSGDTVGIKLLARLATNGKDNTRMKGEYETPN